MARVWFFYTVILGMSFGQILHQLAVAVREWRIKPGQRPFVPVILWQIFLAVLNVQVWLAVTYYRENLQEVSILQVAAFLTVPAGILIMSYMLPGPMFGDEDELTPEVDFARVRPVFFGVLIAMVMVNLLHGFAIGEQGLDVDLLFQALIVLGGVVGLMVRKQRADIVLAAAMIAVLCTYIGVAYSSVSLAA
jgi:hypothetical protein